jgi:hypothetical protein
MVDITLSILSLFLKCYDVSPWSQASYCVLFTNLYSSVINLIVDENTHPVARLPFSWRRTLYTCTKTYVAVTSFPKTFTEEFC